MRRRGDGGRGMEVGGWRRGVSEGARGLLGVSLNPSGYLSGARWAPLVAY